MRLHAVRCVTSWWGKAGACRRALVISLRVVAGLPFRVIRPNLALIEAPRVAPLRAMGWSERAD